jgi:hypothetical protein
MGHYCMRGRQKPHSFVRKVWDTTFYATPRITDTPYSILLERNQYHRNHSYFPSPCRSSLTPSMPIACGGTIAVGTIEEAEGWWIWGESWSEWRRGSGEGRSDWGEERSGSLLETYR